MTRVLCTVLVVVACLISSVSYAQGAKAKVILLISEQNIEGPQRAWWASEVDLSTVEATIAGKLIEEGYDILEPSELSRVITKSRAFRVVNLSEARAVKIGNLSKADYVILGKAVASAGGNVPDSNMKSCFANVTAKVIRVKNGKVAAYLEASGNSAHLDAITGGREALASAAQDLSVKIINALTQEGGK